ncbi:MAG: PPOX class F420-dependent oxidoreductase [Roseiflexaceae bacterium]|nr:PPOX class F420-dependent oxidoreductase [Roseiflexus sp.]MDW8212059.1 PPOX class F420-dependent oxidoreductase [Roseiflexaceae bacterium]
MSDHATKIATIPDSHRDLLERPLIMILATTLPDGTPQATPVWFHCANGYIYLNTAVGRLKDRAIRANPYVALVVVDPDNIYRYIQIRGPVVEVNEEEGRAHIDYLAQRYTGAERFTPNSPDERRVRFKIAPEKVNVMG